MAEADTEQRRRVVPPYVSLKSLFRCFDGFEDALPDHVDRRKVTGVSRAAKAQVMSALTYLGLIDQFRAPTPAFRSLLKARKSSPERWRREFRAVIDAAYSETIDESRLSKMTPKQISKAFGATGMSGHSVPRAIRFYLNALEECGVKVSKSLREAVADMVPRRKPVRGRRPGRPPKNSDNNGSSQQEDDIADKRLPSDGCQSIPVYLGPGREGRIEFPVDVTREECAKFHAAVKYMGELFPGMENGSSAEEEPEEV